MKTINNVSRKKRIQKLRKEGSTLKHIGKEENLSRQRVHQILEEEFLNESEQKLKERITDNFNVHEIFKRGWPDFLVITNNGKICAIEVKSGQDKLSIYQKKVCHYLESGGIKVFISHNGELNKDITSFLSNKKGDKSVLQAIEELEINKVKKFNQLSKERKKTVIRSKALKLFMKKNNYCSVNELADAFGMHENTVRNILKNPIPSMYQGKILKEGGDIKK